MSGYNSGADFRDAGEMSYTWVMTKSDVTRMALKLPIEEQLEIAQTIWERAAPAPDFTLSPELKDLLEARLLEARANPEAGVPWEEVKARLLKNA